MGDLDWALLKERIETKRGKYRFEDVKDRVVKVAFDVFKSTTDGGLWELREEGGTKFLYAIYGDPAELTSTSAPNDSAWKATSDRDGKNVSLAFRGIPLMRFASSQHGFEPTEANQFAEFLEQKVQDPEFVAKMAEQLPESKKALLRAGMSGSTN